MSSDTPKQILNVTESLDGLTLSMRVTPRAKRNIVVGVIGGALKVYIAAPAEDGRANKALIKLLAKTINIKRNQISIISGSTSRKKTIQITGISSERLRAQLNFSKQH